MAIQNSAFVPPSPGVWELEQTHVTRPVSFYMAEVWFEDMKRRGRNGIGVETRLQCHGCEENSSVTAALFRIQEIRALCGL